MKKVQYLLFIIILWSCSKDKGMKINDETVINNFIKSEQFSSIEKKTTIQF